MKKRITNNAFTLIEILIVIAISAILVTGLVSFSSNTLVAAQFNTLVYEIKQTLLNSQKLSRENYLNVTSGAYIDSNELVAFSANAYSSSDTLNSVTELPNTINIINNTFTDNEIYFQKYSGKPIESGSFTITSSDGKSAAIAISTEGIINVTFN